MKIKEITTVAIAGIISLAALVVLETKEEFPASSLVGEATDSEFSFEDNSSLLEPSLPAPTAEPPALAEAEASGEDVPPPVATPLENIPADALIENAPDGAGMEDNETFGPPTSLAGIDPELLNEPAPEEIPIEEDVEPAIPLETPSFDSTFAEAVASATGSEPSARSSSGGGKEGEEPASIIEETPTGFWLREAKLNDVFQHLAQIGNHQFFHNADLDGPSYVVTGQLMDDDPIRQMEELALMYGVTIHKKGNTVYALTGSQLSQLPTEPFRYQLKYLRPSDIEQIKLILQPFLTPGSGIIEYEPKTNTLIVMDNERKLDALALFLSQIDQPKQQIAIETRILRVSSNAANRVGVDWSATLGEDGLGINGVVNLNSLFNLPDVAITTGTGTTGTTTGGSELVLNPAQLSAVLRALNEGGLAQQESSPTLITEDNEEGLISIIDRVPIITTTVSDTSSGTNRSDEVRYSIDSADPVGDPATTREIGVSVSVTPTILPDNTIRMALRPRSAQIVEFVQGSNGNSYPRVNESTVTTTARVPNGHSLLIGGFYEENSMEQTNKVPVLGDIPAVNLLFKSKETIKEHTSLVFIITPKLYLPASTMQNDLTMHEIHDSHVLPTSYDYPNPEAPGNGYKSNLRDAANNIFNRYEPDAPTNILHPAHPYNLPQSQPLGQTPPAPEPQFDYGSSQETPEVTVRPVNEDRPKGRLFGNLFGKNKGANQ